MASCQISWSEDETDFLRCNYNKMGAIGVAKCLSRTRLSVSSKAVRLKLYANIKKVHQRYDDVWSEAEVSCLRKVYPKEGVIGFKANFSNRTFKAIQCKAHKLGLKFTRTLPEQCDFNSYAYHYLQGVLAGDGYIGKNGAFDLMVIDEDFRDNFVAHGKKLGFNVRSYMPKESSVIDGYNRKRTYRAILCSKLFCRVITNDSKHLKVTTGFVNGFIDAEGSVHVYKKYNGGYIRIANTKLYLLKKIGVFLNCWGIKSYVRCACRPKLGHKQCYQLFISSKHNVMCFHKHFYFSIGRKQDRLNKIISSYNN